MGRFNCLAAEIASSRTIRADMLVKTALSDGDLRSAIPMDERISYFPRRLDTRLLIHSATPDNTGQALSRKNASSPVTFGAKCKSAGNVK